MRAFRRIAALAALTATISGCAGAGAGPANRQAILDQLNPAPMSERAWAQAKGTYSGPVHSSTERYGFEGLSSTEIHLELSGWADAPDVILRMDTGYSTAWTMYGEWKGTYTNIPAQRYGTQGTVNATTHAPNQLLLVLIRNGGSRRLGHFMILTFMPGGKVYVDKVGESGWRGNGELWRVPLELSPR